MRKSLVLACVCALLLAGCGDKKATTTTASANTDRFGCVSVAAPPKVKRTAPKPTALLDLNTRYEVTMSTNCGDFTIELDPVEAPHAAASFVSLVKHGFYDHTTVHRVIPDVLIQAGDPSGTGTGGSGYLTHDLPFTNTQYGEGMVAMAKTGYQMPGTASSQFFIVTTRPATGATADDEGGSGLPAGEYALIGRVVKGLDVVRHIDALGDILTLKPKKTVVIERATVTEGR